jgi:hypothetical protein
MNHDFESKQWADNHQVLSDGIDSLFSLVGNAVRKLWSRAIHTPEKCDDVPDSKALEV